MKKSTLDSYQELLQIRSHRANSAMAAVRCNVAEIESRLSDCLRRLDSFEKMARELVLSGVSAAQWALIQNGRQKLLRAIDTDRDLLERTQLDLSQAQDACLKTNRARKRADRVGERFETEERRLRAGRRQLELDEIAASAATRKA